MMMTTAVAVTVVAAETTMYIYDETEYQSRREENNAILSIPFHHNTVSMCASGEEKIWTFVWH